MTNVMIAGSNDSQVNGTFGASSGTLSEQFDLTNNTLGGLQLDGASNGSLTFLVSPNLYVPGTQQNNYRPVYNGDGTVYTLTIPSGNVAFSAAVIVSAIAPYRYVRLLSSVTQNSVAARFIVKA